MTTQQRMEEILDEIDVAIVNFDSLMTSTNMANNRHATSIQQALMKAQHLLEQGANHAN
jgi:hypothetical protein